MSRPTSVRPSPRPPQFKPPFMKPKPTAEPSYNRPQQRPNPIPTAHTLNDRPRKQVIDKEAEEQRKKQSYQVLFDRVEKSLTLDNATDKAVLEDLRKLAQLTSEIHAKHGKTGMSSDGECGQMDAYGTQFWNISVSLLQIAGDSISDEQKRFIAEIRSIAVMQLELGAIRPLDAATASRLVTTQLQTALFCGPFSFQLAQTALQGCKEAIDCLKVTGDSDSKALAAEARAGYHCANYVWKLASQTGLPEYELEKAIDSCQAATTESWAYNETINNCIDYAQKQYQDGMGTAPDKPDRLTLLQTARTLLDGALRLMGENRRYLSTSLGARKLLAHCHYELAQANNDTAQYELANAVLLERENSLRADGPALAQSMLLRLEILEERGGSAEIMNVIWQDFAAVGVVKPDDISRIISLLAKREDERLLKGNYIYQVGTLITGAILQHRENESQRMIGKLLVYLIGTIRNRDDLAHIHNILNHISASGYSLNEDVSLACQTALFKFGDDRQQAELIETAGHHAFASQQTNMVKALRKAAWIHTENKQYERAAEILQRTPDDERESCLTMLGRCIVHARLKAEALAIQSLKAIVNTQDGQAVDKKASETLPLIVKVAQELGMKELQKEALIALAKLIKSNNGGSQGGVPTIMRTVLSLQLEAAAKDGAFNTETIKPFKEAVELSAEVIFAASTEDPASDTTADITTWIAKTIYNVGIDENHAIDPETRFKLIEVAIEILYHRKSFDKSMDDESYHVLLWAELHCLTAQATVAKTIDVKDGEDYQKQWMDVFVCAGSCLEALAEAQSHNTGGKASFKNTDTAVEVVLAGALLKLKHWNEITTTVQNRESIMSLDAKEAIAYLACKDANSPKSLRGDLIMAVMDSLWNHEKGEPINVPKFAAWTQKLLQLELEEGTHESIPALGNMLHSVRNNLVQSTLMRQKWPRDNLLWMYTTSWDIGLQLVGQVDREIWQGFLGIAFELAELDESAAQRRVEMERELNAIHASLNESH